MSTSFTGFEKIFICVQRILSNTSEIYRGSPDPSRVAATFSQPRWLLPERESIFTLARGEESVHGRTSRAHRAISLEEFIGRSYGGPPGTVCLCKLDS